MEFCISSLPTETQKALTDHVVSGSGDLSPERIVELDEIATEVGAPDLQVRAPLTEDERDAAWANFEGRSKAAKAKALRKVLCLKAIQKLMADNIGRTAAVNVIAPQFGFSATTIFKDFSTVRGRDPGDWAALLVGNKPGGIRRAEFDDEAWQFIRYHWLTISQPPLETVVERARLVAKKTGWIIPSIGTIRKRINQIPRTTVIYKRCGDKALHHTYHPQIRDASAFKVNERWETDGHRADVFVRDETGKIYRPMISIWRDLRTRRVMGWAIGKEEDTSVVRRSFNDSIKRSQALPSTALMDNGRANASKEMTGGQRSRFRGKIKEDEIDGILTTLGIITCWAMPESGQSKPIERFFKDYANNVDKWFPDAYCGNSPHTRPEGFDPKKNPVDLETYKAAIGKWLVQYDERPHSAIGLDGKSPKQLYSELIEVTPVRKPTASQIRMSMMVAKKVKLQGPSQYVNVMGNHYWTKALSDLTSTGPYIVKYDPDDANKPVNLYDGETFLFEVPLFKITGFGDRGVSRDYNRARNRAKRADKQRCEAEAEQYRLRNKFALEAAEAAEFGEFDAPSIPQTVHPKPQTVTNSRARTETVTSAEILDVRKRLEAKVKSERQQGRAL